MSHREEAEQEVKIDMTPMIDCVFLLIIFFLCIDFKTLEAKVPAYLPKDKGSNTTQADPIEQLSLRIECKEFGEKQPRRRGEPLINPKTGRENAFLLVGHRIWWELGPEHFDDIDRLADKLKVIAKDPSKLVDDKDNPGQKKLIPIVIEPQPSTTYGDVAMTVDAVYQAGFQEINFGGGRGARK